MLPVAMARSDDNAISYVFPVTDDVMFAIIGQAKEKPMGRILSQ